MDFIPQKAAITTHVITQKINSHLWDFGVGGAGGGERLDFLLIFRPLCLFDFPIKYSLRAFTPYVRTPYHHFSSWDYTKKVIIPQDILHVTFIPC
jgi:hypothetical protein